MRRASTLYPSIFCDEQQTKMEGEREQEQEADDQLLAILACSLSALSPSLSM